MNDEPDVTPIHEDADQPATKGDVCTLEQRMTKEFRDVHQEMNTKLDAMTELIRMTAKETQDHFEVIAEHIHQNVGGANKDEITSLGDKLAAE